MGLAQIFHMNVVANTTAVRCVEVGAEHFKPRVCWVATGLKAGSFLQDKRNKVGLGVVPLARAAVGVGTSSLEKAQRK